MKSMLFATLLLSNYLVDIAHAGPPIQFGELVLEKEATKKGAYAESVDTSIAYLKTLTSIQDQIKAGKTPNAPERVSEATLFYLTGLYLYCIERSGTCPIIADTLLEVEILRRAFAKDDSCSSMIKFWELWRDNQMEDRARHAVPIGEVAKLDKFNRESLPIYASCGKGRITNEQITLTALSEKYKNSPSRASLASSLLKIIEGLKEKGINVFSATGAGGGA